MHAFRIELNSGDILECSPNFIRPFTLQDLRNIPNEGTQTYALEIGSSQFKRIIDGTTSVESATLRSPATFNRPIPVFALVDGGWLPPPFVLSMHFLLDRNVSQAFEAIRLEHPRPDQLSTHWWLDLLQSPEVVVNPILSAMEGPFRRSPEFGEFVAEFQRASAEIRLQMPAATIIAYEEPHFRAAFQLLTNLQERSIHETGFLMECVPLIVRQVGAKSLLSTEREIFACAKKHKLDAGSLAVIAVLSCLHETPLAPGPSPGRLVLKPKVAYKPEDAYNALADLKHLELLIAARKSLNAPDYALCTCDKGLAIFWCALNPSRGSVEETQDGFRFDFSLDCGLFQGLDKAGLQRLSKAIESSF